MTERLERHIVQLLHDHDCVIVPDFGGFVLNEQPARFGSRLELRPPSKVISFNIHLKMNDGLLLNHMVAEDHLTYEQAQDETRQTTDNWKQGLEENRQLILPEIGKFKLNAEGKWLFEPSGKYNFLKASFGLPALQITPVDASKNPMHEDFKKKRLPVRPVSEEAESEEIFRKHLWLRTSVAAAVLAIAIFSAYLAYNRIYTTGMQEASVGIPTQQEPMQAAKNTPQTEAGTPITDELVSAPAQEENASETTPRTISPAASAEPGNVPAAEAPAEPKTENAVIAPEKYFYIIGGSFNTEKRARVLARQFESKGYKPEILNNEMGNIRVSYHKESDSLKADQYLRKIRAEENRSAWLLKW